MRGLLGKILCAPSKKLVNNKFEISLLYPTIQVLYITVLILITCVVLAEILKVLFHS